MIDRLLDSLKALVREMLSPDEDDEAPVWAPFVPWEYQVSSVTETSFSGRATSSRCPWPDMVNIPLMVGVAGTLIKPAADSLVIVAFVNGDPTRPRCIGWDQTVPDNIGLAGATSGDPRKVHRVGDKGTAGTVQVDPSDLSGTGLKFTNANGASVTIPITFVGGAVVVGPAVPPGPFDLITEATSGSSIVRSG